MSSLPQVTEPSTPAPERNASVVIGHQDFFSILLRCTAGELYKIRRRAMSKVLSIIAITIIVLSIVTLSFPAIYASSRSVESYLPPTCDGAIKKANTQCLDHSPTQEDLTNAAQTKQQAVENFATFLHLPDSLNISVNIINFIGVIALVILAGTIVGGEYSVGSIRIMLTRGPTRTQYLLAKISAVLICAVIFLSGLLIIGIGVGAILSLLVRVGTDFSLMAGTWFLHILLYLLISVLGLFIYSMIAIMLATLGKATAAGVAGALIWWFLEGVVSQILNLFSSFSQNWFSDLLKTIPDYFIGNNISALANNQMAYIKGEQAGSISDIHAILVLLIYLAVFIGITWWVHQTRDITN